MRGYAEVTPNTTKSNALIDLYLGESNIGIIVTVKTPAQARKVIAKYNGLKKSPSDQYKE